MNTKKHEYIGSIELPYLLTLYEMTEEFSIKELGSSSIFGDKYAHVGSKVRDLMRKDFGIVQYNLSHNKIWESVDNKSAVFYFGGIIKNEKGVTIWVWVHEYIEKLLQVTDKLSDEEKISLDELSHMYFKAIQGEVSRIQTKGLTQH